MGLIRYAINNPMITNLMLVLVFVAGVISWYSMPQEMFPVIELDRVSVVTEYKGAAPVEVERQVTVPIEEELDSLADIDDMISTSSEGLSNVSIKLKPGSDVDAFLDDVRSIVDRITDLPDEVEEPQVRRTQTRFPVISLAVYGDVTAEVLYDTADDIKRRLLTIPGVASAQPAGVREWEVWVVVDPNQLAAYGITLDEISKALRQNLSDLPGGSIKASEGDILLRGVGRKPDAESVLALPLRSNSQGGVLRLGLVAEVSVRFEEARTIGHFNGKPSVNITVTKTADSSTIDVSKRVHQLALQLKNELPPSIQAGVFSDLSVYVKNRLNTVKSSGLVGLVLVLLSLYLFLNFRVALITAMGIPVSFLIALVAMNYLGHTINMVSLFAFLIALGMIVDDAIIVTENIYRHLEMGKAPRDAALTGTREVVAPVIASTATTIAAFLPVFAIGGTMGAFVAVIPIVVTCALLGSLWEAFSVLPSHASEFLRVDQKKKRGGKFWKKLLSRYAGILHWSVLNRYFVAVATLGVLIIFITIAATRVPFQFFGSIDTGQFFVNIETPNTYSLDDSEELASHLEDVFKDVVETHELKSLLTNVGVSFIDFNTVKFGSKHIQFIVDLEKQSPQGFIENWITPIVSLSFSWDGERERNTEDVINELRQRLLAEPGIQRLSILRPQGGPGGADVEVGVSGKDIKRLFDYGEEISAFLQTTPGVYDVRLDMEEGKLEYQYIINERGHQLGLTQMQLANAVRRGFQGEEVTQVNWRNERIPVRLIYKEAVRKQVERLERLPVVLPEGRVVILGDVADIKIGRGVENIKHRDLRRLVTVTAEVDDNVTTALDVSELIKNEFAALEVDNSGYSLVFLGEKKETSESMRDMMRALVIALFVIFFILAVLFRSLLDPFVVMFSIPFGLIGVVVGHMVMGENLQFLSMLGFLALSGIVVNDSLILIEFAKRLMSEGWERLDAVVEAGRVRARPILLTSVTTFLGVSPLIFFSTGQAAFLSPMAISLGFGLLFATILILLSLPCFYLIADDLRTLCGRYARTVFKIE
ncbi:efflux RND transporter permease subunit [Pseudomonadota bacterium]